ncbi:MAG: hypothetical protein CFE24_10750 [Flavobacterium sp. BFFFF2]|nr:MAG: hypothetical protein CFE24_10750 [Flavobacterium sp. BFFFF2]
MKKIICLLLYIFTNFIIAQNPLIGTWDLIELKSDDMNYNFVTDSISLRKKYENTFKDKNDRDEAITYLRLACALKRQYIFKENEYVEKMGDELLKPTNYKIDSNSKFLMVDLLDGDLFKVYYEVISNDTIILDFKEGILPVKHILKRHK